MTPDELKGLRSELGCTARDLASALGVEQQTVLAWERGELFPTKKFVDELARIREAGPSAVPKRSRKGATPMEALADPAVWSTIRKLLAHDAFRKEVLRLAERYDDPVSPS